MIWPLYPAAPGQATPSASGRFRLALTVDVYPIASDGSITFRDGTKIKLTNEDSRFTSESNGSTTGDVGIASTYSPYRRVISNEGYRKIEGTIVLPKSGDITGINVSGEAAYNYFGLKTNSGQDCEQGLYTQPGFNGGFKVYHSFLPGGGWVADNWPSSPIPAGTSVFMRYYVPEDGESALYISYSGGSNTFVYPVTGLRKDGLYQKMRRVTSFLVNDMGSINNNNIWKSIYIATPSDNHLWTTSDTYSSTATSYCTPVYTNKYYNETVNFKIQ